MARKRGSESPPVVVDVHHRLDALAIAGAALLSLAILMTAIALTLPWWASWANGVMTSWYLGTSCTSGTCTSYASSPSLSGAFGLTNALVMVGFALLLFGIVAFAASLVWPRVGVVTLLLGIVGALLLLGAPIYLYFSLPGALTSSAFPVPVAGFFGSGRDATTSYSWTGAAGWFLAWLIVPTAVLGTAAAHASGRHHVAEEKAFESLVSLEAHTEDGPPEELAQEGDGSPQRFCPVCGARYPGTAELCAKDGEPLKDVVP